MRSLPLLPLLLVACHGDAPSDAAPVDEHATVLLEDVLLSGEDQPTTLALGGDRVLARGEAAQALRGPDTEVVSLAGRAVVPGLTDAHTHLLAGSFVFDKLIMVGTAGMDRIARATATYAAANPDEPWVVGYGWVAQLTEDASGLALDAVVPDRPVVLFDASGHAVLLNSEAMRRAGIDADTPVPPGGRIEVEDGQPTGVLREAAIELVSPVVLDAYGDAALGRNLVDRAEAFVDGGITSVAEILAVPGVDLGRPQVLAAAEADGALPLRISWYLPAFDLDDLARVDEVREAYEGDLVRFAGVKVWVDGTVSSGESWSKEPAVGHPDHHGLHYFDADQLTEFVRAAEDGGWHLKAHVNGDAAIGALLDALERVRSERGELRQRYSLEHALLVAPEDYARMADLGVIASVQPGLALLGPLSTQYEHWADGRSERAFDYRGLLDAGIPLALGTDWPVLPAPPSALKTLRTAVSAEGRQGLTVGEALEGMTRGAAATFGREDEIGCLDPGCFADLLVLSADPRAVAPDGLAALELEQVWVAGHRVR